MVLTTINNIHFIFQIIGKETPDEDWVYVKISYQGKGLKHSYTDPSFMIEEVGELVEWLESILINHKTERRFTPLDQMIDFRFFGYSDGTAKVQIQLNYQYNNTGDILKLNFLLNKGDIIRWMTELKKELSYYTNNPV
jgi:hypothetical protein